MVEIGDLVLLKNPKNDDESDDWTVSYILLGIHDKPIEIRKHGVYKLVSLDEIEILREE